MGKRAHALPEGHIDANEACRLLGCSKAALSASIKAGYYSVIRNSPRGHYIFHRETLLEERARFASTAKKSGVK